MDSRIQILDWDSAFFGFRTARILPPKLGRSELHEILENLRRDCISLAYWFAEMGDSESGAAAASNQGLLVDEKITYALDLVSGPSQAQSLKTETPGATNSSGPIHPPWEISVLSKDRYAEVEAELLSLALRSSTHSRFRHDPRFPTALAQGLYREWMRKSLTGELADAILTCEYQRGLRAMVTVKASKGQGQIGLLACAEGYDGRGLGSALMQASLDWFKASGCQHARVVTQGRNRASCRVYEKSGYRPEKREAVHHFWL